MIRWNAKTKNGAFSLSYERTPRVICLLHSPKFSTEVRMLPDLCSKHGFSLVVPVNYRESFQTFRFVFFRRIRADKKGDPAW